MDSDYPFPWKKPNDVYDDRGPDKNVTFMLRHHTFFVEPTGDTGFDSGRRRYYVKCITCGRVLHENTTGPDAKINSHLDGWA